jgi:hypothetical protein
LPVAKDSETSMLSISPTSPNIVASVPTASAIAFVRVVAPRNLVEVSKDMPMSEQQFVIDSRQVSQKRAKSKEKSAERWENDKRDIERLAYAMLESADGEFDIIRSLPRYVVATAAEVSRKKTERLWQDAVGLALDVVATAAEKSIAAKMSINPVDLAREAGCILDYERDLRIAINAMVSVEATLARKGLCERPYSARQANIVRRADDRVAYLDCVRDQPGLLRVNYRDDNTVPIRFVQSAKSRFDEDEIGYVFDEAAWVGGASTQNNGGTCFQLPFVEKGKRSSRSPMTMRIVAAAPKVRTRRRGISDKAKIQRIMYLADRRKSVKKIAADVGESESRVRGTIHASRNDTGFYAGLNNDRRHLHMCKRVALDQIHGNMRTDCREVIRGDKDEIFETWEECAAYLRTLTVQPQQIVYVRDDRFPERVTKPHLLWILPEKKGVWYDNGVGKAMFDAVAVALTVDARCDLGGLANVGDVKLPTSPHTVAIEWETERLPDLSELCRVLNVDLKQDLDRGVRTHTVAQMVEAGIDRNQSGALYTLFLKRGWEIEKLWEAKRELRVSAALDRRQLAVDLVDSLLADRFVAPELDRLNGKAREAAESSLRTAARKVAEKFGRGHEVGSRGFDLGAAASEVAQAVAAFRENAPADMTPDEFKEKEIEAAQSAGQVYAKKVQVSRTRRRIADAMLAIAADGTDPTNKAVQEITGMDPRTITKHWDPAVALLAANAICAVITSMNHTDTTSAHAPTFCSGLWGVTEGGSLQEQPSNPPDTKGTAIGERFTLDSILSAPIRRLVDRLPRWNPSFGPPTKGRSLTEFSRSGFTLYRSKLGLLEQSRRRQKGRRANPPGSMVDVMSGRRHAVDTRAG